MAIPGLRYVDEEEYVMRKALDNLCRPTIPYTCEHVKVQPDRFVLAIDIPKGLDKPYFLIDKKEPEGEGKMYVRVADRSVQASREVRRIFRKQAEDRDIRFQYGDKEKVLMKRP